MTEEHEPPVEAVQRETWAAPMLKRLVASHDIENVSGSGEDGEGLAAS